MYKKVLISLSALVLASSVDAGSCGSKGRYVAGAYAGLVGRFQGSKAKEIVTSHTGKLAGYNLNGISKDSEVDFEQHGKMGYVAGRVGLFFGMRMKETMQIGLEAFGDLGQRKSYFNKVHTLSSTSSSGSAGAAASPVIGTGSTDDVGSPTSGTASNLLEMKHNFSGALGIRFGYDFSEALCALVGVGGIISDAKYTYKSNDSNVKEVSTGRKYEFGGYAKLGMLYTFAQRFFVGLEAMVQLRANKDVEIKDVKIGTATNSIKFKRKGMFGVNAALVAGVNFIK